MTFGMTIISFSYTLRDSSNIIIVSSPTRYILHAFVDDWLASLTV